MASLLRWVATSGSNIPPHSVEAGHECGKPLFVARAMHIHSNGATFMVPGKAGYHQGGCHTGSNWKSREYHSYEVLTLPLDAEVVLSWETHNSGHVPENAVCGNRAAGLYIGRHQHGEALIPGKLDAKNKGVYIVCRGSEHFYDSYEVLVAKKVLPQSYQMHSVHYDMSRLTRRKENQPIMIASQPAKNSSSYKAEVSVTIKYYKTTSHQWSNNIGVKAGVSTSIKAGVPLFAEGKVEISAEVSYDRNWGEVIEESVEASAVAKVELPPRSHVIMSVIATKQIVDIPYTARVTKMMPDGRQHTTATAGVYKGVTYADFQTSISDAM